ncbi:Anthranilate 1,2-dioxygenase system ferredoxin--NAD(+) reductase component [Variovorax sp. PBS-H4]|uniref:NAD(P)/FAD-dependent oxidoreductase n=1 Tax=Variovorax sp. PBS-H4 TaxID=434008 RepID=UPI0013161046|nr:FAD-dependent oxidoreductase [Variovorax sp. PBS-H4]VTU40436.1 Anthranilate 1,2-dioxygenase system ferredoxin--NAD(+) reductase component [Variovorax sp. PBS-H4]
MARSLPILIVGAGQAGATAAASLRALGHDGPIVMVGSESGAPYERPPLSKAVLLDAATEQRLAIHPAGFHEAQGIELRTGITVSSLDTANAIAHCNDGQSIAYGQALIATGGSARVLPGAAPGTPRVHYIRTLADAQGLRAALQGATALTVLGAGFLGLEVSSTARAMGLDVMVVEPAPRVLARAVPDLFSRWLQERAVRAGVALRLGTPCSDVRAHADHVALSLGDGSEHRAPLLLVAIGQAPEVALAAASGIALHPVNGGIRVDAQCRTSAPGVFAAGDCTSMHQSLLGDELRFESWQNANEQGRIAAAAMLGVPAEPAATPWFWTDQFGCNIQMVGLPATGLRYDCRGDMSAGAGTPRFILIGSNAQARVRHVIAVNAAADLRLLRSLVERGTPCDASRLVDPSVSLRQAVRDALPAATPALH